MTNVFFIKINVPYKKLYTKMIKTHDLHIDVVYVVDGKMCLKMVKKWIAS